MLKKHETLVIASHNPGKIVELTELLKEFSLNIKTANEFDLDEPEETGSTFEENALLKARAATTATGFASIADDSGLSVFALNGEPGIYSARLAGPTKNFSIAMDLIEKKLKEKEARDFSAKFVCTLAICFPDGFEKVFVGEAFGTLTFPPRGTNGFGYDPIFVADGMTETYAQITPQLKATIDHRANAFKKMVTFFREFSAI